MPPSGEARIRAVIDAAAVPLSLRDIAHLARVSPSSVHRAVAALAAAGRVRRRRMPGDPRVYVERVRGRPSPRGKPVTAKARLQQLSDLEAPVWVVRAKDFADYGFHSRLPAIVLIAERWVDRIELAPLHYATMKHARPLELSGDLPAVEVFLALLQLDPHAAKEMWRGGALKKTDPRRLLRRLRAEGLGGPAADAGVSMDRRRRSEDMRAARAPSGAYEWSGIKSWLIAGADLHSGTRLLALPVPLRRARETVE